jgi:hypothetical protein
MADFMPIILITHTGVTEEERKELLREIYKDAESAWAQHNFQNPRREGGGEPENLHFDCSDCDKLFGRHQLPVPK